MESNSLKSLQLAAIHRMLNLNSDTYTNATGGIASAPQWKILIYDAPCRSIISPLLSVSQLRACGVTLHLLLSSDREPIPDVPAVYFCEPTRANLSIIAQDCAKGLYSSAHLNFVTKLPRYLMEEFAKLVVSTNSLSKVASVHDQYLDYVTLEKGLFNLCKKKNYVRYNESNVNEETITTVMDEIAYGLFSAVATVGMVPIIRCPKGGAPEMVARKLNAMISSHPTLSRGKGVSGTSTYQQHHRPLLVILDRSSDLATPIQHSSTYQALIDDLLTHSANRVEFTVQPDTKGNDEKEKRRRRPPPPQIKQYDLDADQDPFYSTYKFSPFPEAIESNGLELQDVSDREAQVKSKTASTDDQANSSLPDPSLPSDLASAVDSLPALIERKRQLEVHTSILQAVMNQVAERDVPIFYELENALASGTYKSDLAKAKEQVVALLKDPNKGNVSDKLRLLMIFCLNTDAPSSDIDDMLLNLKQAMLSTAGSDGLSVEAKQKLESGYKALAYLKRLRSMQMMHTNLNATELTSSSSIPGSGGAGSDMLSSFMARAQTQATGLLAKATEKVSTMFGKTHKFYATQVVENLCEMKPNTEDDTFLYLDPKIAKGEVNVSQLSRGMRGQVREVMVFMVGGGCYSEYQNLQMVSTSGTGSGGNGHASFGGRRVSYGCTELVNPEEFMAQLAELG